jgi:hypothetical protein
MDFANANKKIMKKSNSVYSLVKIILLAFLCSLSSYQSFAGGCSTVNCGRPCYECRISAEKKSIAPLVYSDTDLLNLKTASQSKVVATNSSITIDQADFEAIAQNGNTWVDFKRFDASFSMNIGTANPSSPQIFTLPANLLSYFKGYERLDFVSESAIPAPLQVSGSEIAAKRVYVDEDRNVVNQYYHVNIDTDGVEILGTSYDFFTQNDDNFGDDPDYTYFDVPMSINDEFVTITEESDYETDESLVQYTETKTVNGYGNLVLPNGSSVACLRIKILQEKRSRASENVPFPTNPDIGGTKNRIAFMSKQGHYFEAETSAFTGNVTLSNLVFRFVQTTNTLSELSDVKINNNSRGVTINTSDDSADPSAILDVKSENKGILIPRVTQANRPVNPADGLIIYQIDGSKGLYVYVSGTGWLRLATE